MKSLPQNTGIGPVLTAITVSLLLLVGLLPVLAAPRITPLSSKVHSAAPSAKCLIMAHYMPWFQAKPFSPQWGWHWTMNHFDPNPLVNGRRAAASHDYPLIGLYDSADPDALQCQALLMKLSGIDGVIFDWYGNDDYFDYGVNNRNTMRMIPILRRAGLHFAICYETQTVPKEIAGSVFPATGAVAHGQHLMQWMQANFFSSPAYLKMGNRPVLLSFGDPYYKDSQWNEIFSVLQPRPLYFTESDRQEPTASVGGFDWPQPGGGTAQALQEQERFLGRAKSWLFAIAAAFPRFHDIYSEAGLGKSWGQIDDSDGRTYEDTFTKALQSSAPIVQLVTWNDWGEGTQIEPSVETGYRDLETTQRLRRKYLDRTFPDTAQDLRLPVAWYLLRKKYATNAVVSAKLAAFFPLAAAGHMAQARALLTRYGK